MHSKNWPTVRFTVLFIVSDNELTDFSTIHQSFVSFVYIYGHTQQHRSHSQWMGPAMCLLTIRKLKNRLQKKKQRASTHSFTLFRRWAIPLNILETTLLCSIFCGSGSGSRDTSVAKFASRIKCWHLRKERGYFQWKILVIHMLGKVLFVP